MSSDEYRYYTRHFQSEIDWLNSAKTVDELNKAWDDVLVNLGLELDTARDSRESSSYRNDAAASYRWGMANLPGIYEQRMQALGGTPYPEEYMKVGEVSKHNPGAADYEAAQKAASDRRKQEAELNESNAQIKRQQDERRQQQDEMGSGLSGIRGNRDSSQTMLTGRNRGDQQTMLTRGYQRRTLMGG